MGLDQFAYRVKKGFIKEPVDFRTEQYNEGMTHLKNIEKKTYNL